MGLYVFKYMVSRKINSLSQALFLVAPVHLYRYNYNDVVLTASCLGA